MHNITISNIKPFGASLEKIRSFKKNPDFYELIFEKVRLKSKQDELIAIFENEHPGHYEKLYFCGFLLNVLKVTPADLLDITVNQSAWGSKDERMHYLQIQSVIRSIQHQQRHNNSISVFSDSPFFLTDFENIENTEQNSNSANTVKKNIMTENNTAKTIADFEPRICQIGTTTVKCYFKKCESCTLNDKSCIQKPVNKCSNCRYYVGRKKKNGKLERLERLSPEEQIFFIGACWDCRVPYSHSESKTGGETSEQ